MRMQQNHQTIIAILIIACAVGTPVGTSAQEQDSQASPGGFQIAVPSSANPPSPETSELLGQEAPVEEAPVEETLGEHRSEAQSESEFRLLEGDGNSDQASAGQAHPLSVAPGNQPLLPKDKPKWVAARADYSMDTHRLFVGSTITSRPEKADAALDEPLVAAVLSYLDDQVFRERGASSDLMSQVTPSYIRRNLIDEPAGYLAEVNTIEGPMYQKWVALSITAQQREQMQQWHNEATQRSRLVPLGVGLLSIVALVGLAHLVLRRKHGLPTPRPLRGEEIVDARTPPAQRATSAFSALIVLGCVFVFPAMIAASWLFARSSHRETTHVVAEEVKAVAENEVKREIQHSIEIARSAVKSALQPPPVPPTIVESSSQEIRIIGKSGQQQLIIRDH